MADARSQRLRQIAERLFVAGDRATFTPPDGASPVVAVNLTQQLALLEDGRTAPIVDMFDINGDETEYVDDVVTAVALHPDNLWCVIEMCQFDSMTLN